MVPIAPQLTVADALAAAERLAPLFAERAAMHDREGSFPFENFAEIRAARMPAFNVPVAYGGCGATLLDSVRLLESLAKGDGSTALSFAMHVQTIGNTNEARTWRADVLERVYSAAVNDGALINSVASEPELGSPSRGGKPKTTATPLLGADGTVRAWRIDGHKNYASMSPTLDFMIIPALLQDGSDETARFLVEPARLPVGALQIVESWDALGMRATGSHDVVLRGVEVDNNSLLSRGAEGAAARITHLNTWFMLCVSAVYLGVAVGGLHVAARYALDRVPTGLGKPIAEVDAIRRQLGQAEFLLEQARICVQHVAALHDRMVAGDPVISAEELSPLIAVAKVTATNNAIAAMEHCMRVAGGQAMSRAFPLERHFRDVRGGLNHPINDEAAWLMFGKRALDRDGKG